MRSAAVSLRIVTYAPEEADLHHLRHGAKEMRVVLSAGHSNAIYGSEYTSRGNTCIDHLYNAQRTESQRAGVTGYGMLAKGYTELILMESISYRIW